MKRYIKSNTDSGLTIREYIDQNKTKIADRDILVVCMKPYDEKYPDDVPGVLFDGSLDELYATADNIEDNIGDNYLIRDDLDEVKVEKADYNPDYVTIYLERYW